MNYNNNYNIYTHHTNENVYYDYRFKWEYNV